MLVLQDILYNYVIIVARRWHPLQKPLLLYSDEYICMYIHGNSTNAAVINNYTAINNEYWLGETKRLMSLHYINTSC